MTKKKTKVCGICENPLNKGNKYCSYACSGEAKKRKAKNTPNVPDFIKSNEIVYEEVLFTMTEDQVNNPKNKVKTEGDWLLSFGGRGKRRDFRQSDKLSFEIIEQMLQSGIVMFALEMKMSQIISVFRNTHGWRLNAVNNKALGIVVKKNLERILPKMMLDLVYSSLVYGISLMELSWSVVSKTKLGIKNDLVPDILYTVANLPKTVNPKTVISLLRDSNNKFSGFEQARTVASSPNKSFQETASSNIIGGKVGNGIKISAEDCLVVPYRDRFRNLWGESFFKTIYPYWMWYEIVLRSMVRYMERMGTPVVLVRAPSKGTVRIPGTNETEDAMVVGLTIASSVAYTNSVGLPSDRDENGHYLWDLSYMTADEKSQPFIDVLDALAQLIFRAALTADRATSQSSGGIGSNSIGVVHAKATALANEGILQNFLYYINKYFMPKYSLYNGGIEEAPILLETEGLDSDEREFLIKLFGISGNSSTFQDALMMIDWRTLAELNNVPVLSEEDADKLKKEHQATADKTVLIPTDDSIDNETIEETSNESSNKDETLTENKLEALLEMQKLIINRLKNNENVPLVFNKNTLKKLGAESEESTK